MEPEKLVLKGCGSACQHKPCPFGTCVDRDTSYECDCTETPFYGTYCSKGNYNYIDHTVSSCCCLNGISLPRMAVAPHQKMQ